MEKIKTKLTCVRMPGGKSNALKTLDPYFIKNFSHYREPFFGGGSVGLYLMQFNKDATYWINDLFYPVYCFWKTLYDSPNDMVKFLQTTKLKYIISNDQVGIKINGKKIPSKSAEKGRELHNLCRKIIQDTIKDKDIFHTGCIWYILNKLSYSGMSMIGNYAPLAWDQNFTDNCIINLPKTSNLMHSVKELKITNLDYSELLNNNEENIFIFMDPPYDIKHNLYGNNGDMHDGFNHEKFGEDVKKCNHKWMITYNDNEILKKRFSPYFQESWDLQYTMKAAKREGNDGSSITGKSGRIGKELLIWNYALDNNSKTDTVDVN